MPRGGRRPGAGARKGNTNALKRGGGSQRAQQLHLAMQAHPNRWEIFLLAKELGALSDPFDSRTFDMARFVRIMHPAVFDPEHVHFARVNAPPPHWQPGQKRRPQNSLIVFRQTIKNNQRPTKTVKRPNLHQPLQPAPQTQLTRKHKKTKVHQMRG